MINMTSTGTRISDVEVVPSRCLRSTSVVPARGTGGDEQLASGEQSIVRKRFDQAVAGESDSPGVADEVDVECL